jgi:hypothetical protein
VPAARVTTAAAVAVADDRGVHAEPGDDRGRHAEPGDDHGRHGGHDR